MLRHAALAHRESLSRVDLWNIHITLPHHSTLAITGGAGPTGTVAWFRRIGGSFYFGPIAPTSSKRGDTRPIFQIRFGLEPVPSATPFL